MSLLLTGCYKTALGLRGMSGLGEVMTASPQREVAEVEPMSPIVDAHTEFENPNDEAGTQPGWGMEVAFRGANVLGSIVLPGQMRFFPRLDKKFAPKLTICGSGESPASLKLLAHGLDSGHYQCIHIPASAPTEIRNGAVALAAKHHVAVMLDGRLAKTLDWEPLIAKHPEVNFVLSALGWPSPKDGLWLVAKYPNAYVDTSVVVHPDVGLKAGSEIAQKIQELLRPFAPYPQKVLFGSSHPLAVINPGVLAVRAVFAKEHWPEVLYGNAIRIYKMDLNESAFEVASTNSGKKQDVPAGN